MVFQVMMTIRKYYGYCFQCNEFLDLNNDLDVWSEHLMGHVSEDAIRSNSYQRTFDEEEVKDHLQRLHALWFTEKNQEAAINYCEQVTSQFKDLTFGSEDLDLSHIQVDPISQRILRKTSPMISRDYLTLGTYEISIFKMIH